MKKLLHNKNFYLILILILLIAALLVIGPMIRSKPASLPASALPVAPTQAPSTGEAQTSPSDAGTQEEMPLGYILVQAGTDGGFIPLPTGEDVLITISREGDESIKNVLRLFKNGFVMDSSTCDNQNCIHQGEVTLENKDDRLLMGMVLCLPHNLTIELFSTEEMLKMYEDAAAQQNQ